MTDFKLALKLEKALVHARLENLFDVDSKFFDSIRSNKPEVQMRLFEDCHPYPIYEDED